MDVTRVLLSTYLFQDLNPVEVDALSACTTLRRVERGEYVFRTGERADEVWVVAAGQIRECTVDEDGNEYVSDLLTDGAVFGEPGAFSVERTRVLDEVAVTPSTLIRIPRDELFRFLLAHPTAMLRMLEGLASDVRQWSVEEVLRMAYRDVQQRVVERLLVLAGTHGVEVDGDAVRIDLRMSQGELAAMAGCTRENANRVLSWLAARGVLRREGGRIVIVDPAGLRLAARSPQPFLHRRNRRVEMES